MTTINLKAKHARLLFKRLVLFTASDDTHPILEAIHVTPLDGRVVGAATDGRILGIQSVPVEVVEDGEPLLVHRDSAKVIAQQIKAGNYDDVVQIRSADGSTICKVGSITTSDSVQGTYPDYRHLIPNDLGEPSPVALNAALIARVVRAVSVDRPSPSILRCYTRGSREPVVFTVGSDTAPFMAVVMPMFVGWEGNHFTSAVQFLKAAKTEDKPKAAKRTPRKLTHKKEVTA
jgi:hypothetical protein